MEPGKPSHASALTPRSHVPVVFVVDDDISVREALASVIRYEGWQPVTFASANDFLAFPRTRVPSCLVLDVYLPDLNGLDLQNRIAADRMTMPIIFLTGHGDVPITVRAMKEGAFEFLTKPWEEDVLRAAIGNALGRSEIGIAREERLQVLRHDYSMLTGREREILTLVVAGRLNKQIGAALGISELTVKAHRGHMMRKMHAASLADLVTQAGHLHILPTPDSST
ncbi:MAG: tmoT 2 [Gemmatimonadetes bacterium]|nr:tmoT 2 [Gemmatimonadota bacterium]